MRRRDPRSAADASERDARRRRTSYSTSTSSVGSPYDCGEPLAPTARPLRLGSAPPGCAPACVEGREKKRLEGRTATAVFTPRLSWRRNENGTHPCVDAIVPAPLRESTPARSVVGGVTRLPGCVREFLESRPVPPERDALHGLAVLDESLRAIFRELVALPGRAESAIPLLRFLAEHRRELLEEAGEQALARVRVTSEELSSAFEELSPTSEERSPASELAGSPAASVPRSPPLSTQEILTALLERVGPPAHDDPESVAHEIGRLASLASDDAFEKLRCLKHGTRRAFLGMIAARIASAHGPGNIGRAHPLRPLVVMIRQFTICERSGPVRGLKPNHAPQRGTWHADAEHLWRVLGGRNLETR